MTKYKLIKEYPGSPKLNTIIDNIYYIAANSKVSINVLEYPEFWEKINNNFVLPKIWWIKITKENLKDVIKFLGFNLSDDKIGYVAGMVKCFNNNEIEKGYNKTPTTIYGSTFGNEITYEQFKKYVLKETEEKIVKKDYEIISYLYKPNGSIVSSSNFAINIVKDEKSIYKIHSVKRLSDGEIFTIGDIVLDERPNYSDRKGPHKISEISLQIHGIMIHWGYTGANEAYLNSINKVKQPLFTTEDGVDIFKGDRWFIVYVENFNGNKSDRDYWKIYEGGNINNLNLSAKGLKRFSTKEKAEEYILMNKSILSLSDVWDHLSIKNRKFITLFVKNKLNL